MPQSRPPHFGWLKPSEKKDGGFDFKIEGTRLGEDQWAECDRAAKYFARVRPFILDYLIADEYYGDVLRAPEQIAAMLERDPFLIQKVGLFHIKSHLICDRAVNGFVSAGRVFRDRLVSRLHIKKDSNHPLLERIRVVEERSFEYRLLSELRNFGQHNDAIINAIPMSTDAESDQPTSVRIVISPSRLLLKMMRLNARLRSDLEHAPEEIDFVAAATSYMECLREIFAAFLALDGSELAFAIRFVQIVRSGARGLPAGATPILLDMVPEPVQRGKVTKGTLFNMSAMFLPLDEASLLEQLFPQLATANE